MYILMMDICLAICDLLNNPVTDAMFERLFT